MSADSKQRSAKQCHGELVTVQGKVSTNKSPEAVLQCMHMTWLAVSILADGRPPNRLQVHDILFPILGSVGRLLRMYQERTILASRIHSFHQLAAATGPRFIGEGDSFLYKVVKNLDLAECSGFCMA